MTDQLEEIKQFEVSGDTAWAWRWLITEVERLRLDKLALREVLVEIREIILRGGSD